MHVSSRPSSIGDQAIIWARWAHSGWEEASPTVYSNGSLSCGFTGIRRGQAELHSACSKEPRVVPFSASLSPAMEEITASGRSPLF